MTHLLLRKAAARPVRNLVGKASSSVLVLPSASGSSIRLLREFHASPACQDEYPLKRHGTTIVCVRKNGQVCMMGDGMVSQGSMIVKNNTNKIRVMKDTLVGFAGSTADAFTLLERLEGKLDEYPGQLTRSCVELAKGWRTDKYLRRLEASLVVADANVSLEVTGNGDVLESTDGILGVGSGSPYAIAAAKALIDAPDMTAKDVAEKAMGIAASMCVYTNENFVTHTLEAKDKVDEEKA